MSHLHPVYDTDCHFKIDPDSRDITYEGTDPLVLIQNDHNSEHYTFEIPRLVDGHDMSLCTSVQIHYINIDSANGVRSVGVYEVDDLQLAPDDEDVVIGSWAISQNATKFVGSLIFAIRFACMTEATLDYVWNTTAYSGVKVSSGIYNGEVIAEQYADILQSWYNEFITAGTGIMADINAHRDSCIDDINHAKIKAIDEIENSLEDIDRALDTLLNIQEMLIGGGK